MAERSLLAIAIERRGVVGGARVLAFMVGWAQARAELAEDWPRDGVEAQIRAYSKWQRVTERTGWNELVRFREVWPDERTPSRLLDEVHGRWQTAGGVADLGAVVPG